jgi:hypothetical protein
MHRAADTARAAMPKARKEAAEKQEKSRLQKQRQRASFSPAKRLAINTARWIVARCHRCQRDQPEEEAARRSGPRDDPSSRATPRCRKSCASVLLDEEPIVADVDVKNIEEAYAFARAAPRDFDVLTGETPESFDELYGLAADKLRARTWRGTDRQRAAAHAPRVSDKLQLFICLLFLRQYPTSVRL